TDKHEQGNQKTLHREETVHVLGAVQASKRVSVRQHLRTELRVDLWKSQVRALTDGSQFALRTFERRTGRDPPEHHTIRPHRCLRRRQARAQRYPYQLSYNRVPFTLDSQRPLLRVSDSQGTISYSLLEPTGNPDVQHAGVVGVRHAVGRPARISGRRFRHKPALY